MLPAVPPNRTPRVTATVRRGRDDLRSRTTPVLQGLVNFETPRGPRISVIPHGISHRVRTMTRPLSDPLPNRVRGPVPQCQGSASTGKPYGVSGLLRDGDTLSA